MVTSFTLNYTHTISHFNEPIKTSVRPKLIWISLWRWNSSKVCSQSRFSWFPSCCSSSRWCRLLTQGTPSSAPHRGGGIAPRHFIQVPQHLWWNLLDCLLFRLRAGNLLHSGLDRFLDHLKMFLRVYRMYQTLPVREHQISEVLLMAVPLQQVAADLQFLWTWLAWCLAILAIFHLCTLCPFELFQPFPFLASLCWASVALVSPESDDWIVKKRRID